MRCCVHCQHYLNTLYARMCALSTYDHSENVNPPVSSSDGAQDKAVQAKDPVTDGKYHHGNLRDVLLAAGLLMLESGVGEAFSLRELARQVGVSANAPYRHFPSKDDLLLAMIAEGFNRLTAVQMSAQMAAIQAQASAADVFLAAGLAYIHFARDNPGLFRLMFGAFAAANVSEEKNSAANAAFANLNFGMAAALELPVDDTRVTLSAIHAWGLVHGLSQLMLDHQLDDKSTDVDQLIRQVLNQSKELGMQLRGRS